MTRATLIQAREGDQVAMNQVIKDYDPLIIYMTYQRDVATGYFEDYLQVGRLGLVEAIQKVSDNSDYQFSTFASRYIRNEMALLSCQIRGQKLHEYRVLQRYYFKKREMEQRFKMEIDMMDVIDEMKLYPFQKDIIKSHAQKHILSIDVDELVTRKLENEIEENDLERLHDGRTKMLNDMLERLTERQMEIVEMHYYHGMTSSEIALELSVHQGYILKELSNCRGKLLKDWPNQLFMVALESEKFYNPDHTFHMEKWRPVAGGKYSISNYGRILTYHKGYKRFLIRKPSFESRKYRYHLVFGNTMMKATPAQLIAKHFDLHELPTFYEES